MSHELVGPTQTYPEEDLHHKAKEIKYRLSEEGCWICTSHSLSRGYPNIRRNGSIPQNLHRYIYIQEYGEVEEGKMVLHRCGNKKCINTDHLYVGDEVDNGLDASRLGELDSGNTKGYRKYSEEKQEEVLQLLKDYTRKEVEDITGVPTSTIDHMVRGEYH